METLPPSEAFLSALAESLNHSGEALLRDSTTAGPLHNVERLLWTWEQSGVEQPKLRHLIFFLKVFIDQVFYNLSGDVPSIDGLSFEVQTSFCTRVGHVLNALADSLRRCDYAQLYDCCVTLANAYLDAIATFNEAFRKAHK